MIVVLKSGVEQEKQAQLIDWLSEQGLQGLPMQLFLPRSLQLHM